MPEVVGRASWQEAADIVRDRIRSGLLATGDRLPPERDFARELGIARPTLREALKALQAEGYLETRRGAAGGSFVADTSALQQSWLELMAADVDELNDILDFRIAVESQCSYLAAQRRTKEDLELLDSAIAAMSELTSAEGFRQTDAQFHSAVTTAARSPRLERAVHTGRAAMFLPVDRFVRDYRIEDTLRAHIEVLEAVRSGDAEQARAAMAAHVEHTRRELHAVLKEAF